MVDSARHTRWRVPLRIIALLVIVGAMLMGVSPASAATKKLTATPRPTITGSAVVGKKLTAKPGTWKPSSVTLTYQWLRNGKAIKSATKKTYTLTKADGGKKVSVKVTGKKKGYKTVAKTSKATAAVTSPPPSTGVGTLTGTLSDAFGEKFGESVVESLTVSLCEPNEGSGFCSHATGVDAQGRYSITVPAGTYTAWFEQNSTVVGGVPVYQGFWYQGETDPSKRVTIAAGKTTIVDVKLASNRARLTGKVTDASTDKPLSGARVVLYRKGADGVFTDSWAHRYWGVSGYAESAADGRWSIYVPEGTYKVVVTKDRYAETWSGGKGSLATASAIAAPGDKTQTVSLSLAPTHATVSGRVTGSDGSGVISANVLFSRTATDGEKETVVATTDSLGRYSSFVEQDTWEVRVTENQGLYKKRDLGTVAVTAGQDRTIDAVLDLVTKPDLLQYGTLNGYVRPQGYTSAGLSYIDVYAYRYNEYHKLEDSEEWPEVARVMTQPGTGGAFTLKVPTGKYKLAFHDRSRSYEPWGSRYRSAWSGSVPYNFEAVKDAPAEVLTVTVGGTTAADVVLQLAYNN